MAGNRRMSALTLREPDSGRGFLPPLPAPLGRYLGLIAASPQDPSMIPQFQRSQGLEAGPTLTPLGLIFALLTSKSGAAHAYACTHVPANLLAECLHDTIAPCFL